MINSQTVNTDLNKVTLQSGLTFLLGAPEDAAQILNELCAAGCDTQTETEAEGRRCSSHESRVK